MPARPGHRPTALQVRVVSTIPQQSGVSRCFDLEPTNMGRFTKFNITLTRVAYNLTG